MPSGSNSLVVIYIFVLLFTIMIGSIIVNVLATHGFPSTNGFYGPMRFTYISKKERNKQVDLFILIN